MAIASFEIGGVALRQDGGSSINGGAIVQETLDISGSTDTSALAVTAAHRTAGGIIGRLACDTDCYFAVGSTPDPTATAATSATTARRLLSAGAAIEFPLVLGDKCAVKSTA